MPANWTVRIDDRDYPAENLQTLRSWAREGKLQQSHHVYNPTLQRWMYGREVEELKGWFSPSVSVPAGATHVCTVYPHCGNPTMIPLRTPEGQRRLAEVGAR
jgi:hypothetical protein